MSDEGTELTPLEHQVAGCHKGVLSNILKDNTGRIFKPYKKISNVTFGQEVIEETSEGNLNDVCSANLIPVTKNELDFYRKMTDGPDDLFDGLKFLAPKFFGTKENNNVDHLILEDATHGSSYPCILDLKIGKCRHFPGRSKDKLEMDKKKYPSLKEVGFCIAGMKLFNPDGSVNCHLTPPTTRQFTTAQVKEQIKTYLHGEKELCGEILKGLQKISDWCSKQRSLIFKGSSILIIYDATTLTKPSDPSTMTSSGYNVRIKMIDFAHIFYSDGAEDKNYKEGLQNLISVFQEASN